MASYPITPRFRPPAFVSAIALLWAAFLLPHTAQAQSAPASADLIDRIVAVVNGEVITLGELRRAARLSASDLIEDATDDCGVDNAALEGEQAKVLDCMIDDLLVFQHVRRFPQFDVPQEQIDEAYRRMASRYESLAEFEDALRQQDLTPADVRYDLEREALVSNYVNARYTSIVDIDDTDIARYYETVLRPEMVRLDAPMPQLAAVEDSIRDILLLDEVYRRVDGWIADLRRRADIVVYVW